MIGMEFVLGGSKALNEEVECNTNPEPRTVGTSRHRFIIINVNIVEDFLFANSYKWRQPDCYQVTLKAFDKYKHIQ